MVVRLTGILVLLHGFNVEKNPRMLAKVKVVDNGLGIELNKGGVKK